MSRLVFYVSHLFTNRVWQILLGPSILVLFIVYKKQDMIQIRNSILLYLKFFYYFMWLL